MEKVLIKQEPKNCDLIYESTLCCYLCEDGENILKALADHFKEKHFNAFNQMPDESIIEICCCPEITALQKRFFNHLLSKLLKFHISEVKVSNSEVNLKEEVTVEESHFEDPQDHSYDPQDQSDESQSENQSSKEPRVYLKRGRKPRIRTEAELLCSLCSNRKFCTPQSVQNHIDHFHDPTNEFKCNRCEVGSCKTLKNLKSHLRWHDEEDVKKLETKICTVCSKSYENDAQLLKHMAYHREDSYECDQCGLKLLNKSATAIHVLTHLPKIKKPKKRRIKIKKRVKVLCQFCSLWLSNDNIARHIRRFHSENKYEYKCDHDGCSKSFTTKPMLKDHKNIHTGLKPYVCPFCGEQFSHIAVLRRHKYRHTDPDKYKCQVCGERFVSKRGVDNHNLRKHEDVGNDSKPFGCDFPGCISAFKYEEYLQGHKREVHLRKRKRTQKKRDRRRCRPQKELKDEPKELY